MKLSMLLWFYDAVSSTLKDAMELDQLISHLINKEDSEGVVLLGHSTGCQVSTSCIIIKKLGHNFIGSLTRLSLNI